MDKNNGFIPRAGNNTVENRVIACRPLCGDNVGTDTPFLNGFGVQLNKPFPETSIVSIIIEYETAYTVLFLGIVNPLCKPIGTVIGMRVGFCKVLRSALDTSLRCLYPLRRSLPNARCHC